MEGLAGCSPAGSNTWGAHAQRGWCVYARCQLLDLRETLTKLVTLKERLTKKKLMIVNDHLLLVVSGVGLLHNLDMREGGREGEQHSYVIINTISPGLVLTPLYQVCLEAHKTEHKLSKVRGREKERGRSELSVLT